MGFVVLILFLLLTFYEIKVLYSGGTYFKSPFDKEQLFLFDGSETFWVILYCTGIVALSANFGLDLMAIRLLVLEVLCLVAALKVGNSVMSTPMRIYALFLFWLIIGCFYSPAPFYGVRVFLKYTYPILIALAASAIVRNIEVGMKALLWARKIAVVSIVFFFVPGLNIIGGAVFWYATALAITYQFMCILSVALFFFTDEKRKNMIYAILFCIPCILWVFRTSIMGTALALMIFSFFKYKLKSLPVIFGVLILFIVAIFTIPAVKNKMFIDKSGKDVTALQEGKISFDDINSNGRFAMWEWSLDHFFVGKELTGSGTGNMQETFYAGRHPFIVKICHNDYVQMLCDNGLIGLVLFASSFLGIIFHCFIVFSRTKYGPPIKIFAVAAGASLGGMLLSMYTDNAINYTMATFSYPLGAYGMMLGLIRAQKVDY